VVSQAAGATAAAVKALAAELAAITTRPWTLMEVCGGQTHAIVRWGLDQLLPEGVRLIHGPGCPVCVTPAATIEQALQLARRPELIFCSYGDMLRVPGQGQDTLLSVRAAGGDVRLLTSPLQALELARCHRDRQVVFLAVGFETTAPATALLARQALTLRAANLSLLVAHVRVAPAMEALLADPGNRVQGFLAAGHVCSVLGTAELEALVARRRLPVVVTGFEPLELMAGVLACVRQLEGGEAWVENTYGSVVRAEGNPAARALLEEVFEPCDRPWRGLGLMGGGGLALRGPYRALDALRRFGLLEADRGAGDATRSVVGKLTTAANRLGTVGLGCAPCGIPARDAGPITPLVRSAAPTDGIPATAEVCIAGAILRGQETPDQCPAFGMTCTPERPLGAPMVSSEGACAAYFLYRRRSLQEATQAG
jgi:hydrogenase expression/formation protein HypD